MAQHLPGKHAALISVSSTKTNKQKQNQNKIKQRQLLQVISDIIREIKTNQQLSL